MTQFPIARRSLLALAGAALMLPQAALAQSWPSGSVQLVVPARAGGGTDAVSRIIAGALQEQTGQPFVVVNNPGGGGVVAAEEVRNATPDGQTLLFFHTGVLAMHHTGSYAPDPMTAFAVAAEMAVGGTYALAVAADSPYQTLQDLVQASIDNPNSVSMGVQVRGSSHFMAGLLTSDSGARFRIVDAGSDADKMVQLQGHQIDAAMVNTPGTLQYVENGDLRVLATIGSDAARDPVLPDVPSMVEAGYPNALYGLDFLILAPVGTDPAVVQSIHDAFAAVVANEAIDAQLTGMGFALSMVPQEAMQARLEGIDARVAATAELLGLN
ncbi:tripartite tricarboxylate transporter substrate binding protein [Pararhodobacter aggregans]|uniref:Tripartite tricarboxylate transporter substrate binding protein n=1 Tax=Pararhodobacter aggregans TaxID=404875 RepID=A0A2T7UN17_9RHOB|nr:tripartite tricarboxylate transporter substrate binding protein [Pararhodobacter aggregans]PTX02456.1 tripartite-type tricarboxylate transporter receptor subunit TctC [Pararhodobacter aggregans]PVE46067.1 hypothetical protein DDE23_17890 [Pararhodobacter aggregans]